MRTAMREQVSEKEKAQYISERNQKADQLVEKWSREKGLGENLIESYDRAPQKIRNLAIVLENQDKHLKQLTETQISNSFQTTPQNVMRIIRLGYPNSVRGEIFLEWAMETARDAIYYLYPVYGSTARGATASSVTFESSAYRYASELIEEGVTGSINGTNKTFTGSSSGNLADPPIRPYTLKVLHNSVPVATDDGAGNVVGAQLDTAATNTVNYTTGALTINFLTAPATGDTVEVVYNMDTEVSSHYAEIGEVDLQLRDFQFRAKPWPLGISWSKMTELLLGTTLNIDAEEALIRGASEELKKTLDYHSTTYGYRYALGNSTVTFDADFATAGADSEIAHAQSITRKIQDAGNVIYNALNRGGVTKMYGGPGAINYLQLHRRFTDAGNQPKVGVYKVGSLDGMDIYKAPQAIVPTNQIVCVYKNDLVPEDVSLAFGTLVPLYQTQTLEFKQMYKETGLAHFGDWKALQPNYLVTLNINNLP